MRKLHVVALLAGAGALRRRRARPWPRACGPPMPKITAPVMFGTPEADRILEALQVFPPDNPWNQDISKMPVRRTRRRSSRRIGADKPLGYNLDMGFILVPPDQKRVPVKLLDYPEESDPGPYPVPDNAPIENWPLTVNEDKGALPKPGQTLEDLQRDGTGDRHVIVVDPVEREALRVLAGAQDRRGLAGVERGHVRPEDRRAAARALDLGRRGRPADLPGRRALRRVRARHGRARDALHRPPLATRLRAPGHALGEHQHRPVLPAHGRAVPPAPGLRHVRLPAARAGDPRRA